MPQYRCKHCEEEIEYLAYSCDAQEYGSYHIESRDIEINNTESDGPLIYRCQECNYESQNFMDIYEEIEDEDNEENSSSRMEEPTNNTKIKTGQYLISSNQVSICPTCHLPCAHAKGCAIHAH